LSYSSGCKGVFLGAAERYDLIQEIDRWVIDAAFDWLSKRSSLEPLEFCSINLSGRSVGDREFTEFMIDRLSKIDFPPEKLCFEITETVAIANLSRATELIQRLRAIGCRFALDDFGSGLSSFGYLKNLPVDFIKIDGMFVRDILEDPMDLVMVKAIRDLGHVMGKKTIAEFVENERILSKLLEVGIDYAQGFHVGRPRSLDELWDDLKDSRSKKRNQRGVEEMSSSQALSSEVTEELSRASRASIPPVEKNRYRILQVDDDPVSRTVTQHGLELAGFEVWSANSGEEALGIVSERGYPHLALVDLIMPGMGGVELSQRLTSAVDLPIIMLTSLADSSAEVDAITGVAEDYVTKPFVLAVLVARVERLLRRIGDFAYALGPRIVVDGHLEVELGKKRVFLDGREVALTRIETKLLYVLMREAGRAVRCNALLQRVWPGQMVLETVLRTHVARLRAKIELEPASPRYIKTRRGFGYSFPAPS